MLERVEKKEPSYTIDGNVNWCGHYREQYAGTSQKNKNITTVLLHLTVLFAPRVGKSPAVSRKKSQGTLATADIFSLS